MTPRRLAALLGTVAVTGVAAAASFTHIAELAMATGQPAWLAYTLPLSIDGMMLVATVALGDGRRSRWSCWLAFTVGVLASVVANILAAEPTLVARAVSAWPALALVLVVEILARSGREPAAEVQQAPAVALAPPTDLVTEGPLFDMVETPAPQPEFPPVKRTPVYPPKPTRKPAAGRKPLAETRRLVDALLAEQPGLSQQKIADQLGIPRRSVRDALALEMP